MAKRNEHDDEDVDDESNSQLKKQRMDELAVATLPGSMELTSSGAVRNVAPQSILQSSTVLFTGHTEAIYSIAFDPTGMHLASASLDRSISEDSDLNASPIYHIHSCFKESMLDLEVTIANNFGKYFVLFLRSALGHRRRVKELQYAYRT
jgi:WD40 repeat protein